MKKKRKTSKEQIEAPNNTKALHSVKGMQGF
jgi:hypothetical protein